MQRVLMTRWSLCGESEWSIAAEVAMDVKLSGMVLEIERQGMVVEDSRRRRGRESEGEV